jgi:hypothetical protein
MLGAVAGTAGMAAGATDFVVLTPDGVGAVASIVAGAAAGTMAGEAVGTTVSEMVLTKDFGLEEERTTLTMVIVEHGTHAAITHDV